MVILSVLLNLVVFNANYFLKMSSSMQRDSGGPLLCKRQDIWYLTGKTSMPSCEISNKLLWNAKLNRFYVHWEQFTISGIVSWGYGCGTAGLPPVYTHVFEFVTSGWLKTNGDIWETRYFILNMTSILYVVHFKTRTIFAEIKYRVHVVYFKYYLVQSYWEEVIKNPIIRLWNENRIRLNFRC